VSDPSEKAVVVRTTRARPAALIPDSNVLSIVPELARVAAVSWWRATSWSVATSIAATSAVFKRATSGEPPAAVIAGLASDARGARLAGARAR